MPRVRNNRNARRRVRGSGNTPRGTRPWFRSYPSGSRYKTKLRETCRRAAGRRLSHHRDVLVWRGDSLGAQQNTEWAVTLAPGAVRLKVGPPAVVSSVL